ncbi:hypothetical protein Brms1b_001946 [Colletotrichum noveboracense]|nr:hypothetical protein Brms1b_001946 [Colletotrichum noveboracense]
MTSRAMSLTTPPGGDLVRYRMTEKVVSEWQEPRRPQAVRMNTHPAKGIKPHVTFSLLEHPSG